MIIAKNVIEVEIVFYVKSNYLDQSVKEIVQFVLMDYVIIMENVKILKVIVKIMQHSVEIVRNLAQLLMKIVRNVVEMKLVYFVKIKLILAKNATHHAIALARYAKLMELVMIPNLIVLIKYFLGQNVTNNVMRVEIIV